MSIYVLCPRYIEARSSQVLGDLHHMFFRHFFTDGKCRIAVDSEGVYLAFLFESAQDNDLLSRVLSLIESEQLADVALERCELEVPVTNVSELVLALNDLVKPDGCFVCYSKQDYKSQSRLDTLIDRAQVRAHMEEDCGGASVVTKISVSDSSSVNVTLGDNNKIKQAIGEIGQSTAEFSTGEITGLVGALSDAILKAKDDSADEKIVSELEELKAQIEAKNSGGFLAKLKSVSDEALPYIGVLTSLLGVFLA